VLNQSLVCVVASGDLEPIKQTGGACPYDHVANPGPARVRPAEAGMERP